MDRECDPLQADSEGDEGFVGGRGAAGAHGRDSVGEAARDQAEVSCGLLLGVAFADECEDPAASRGFGVRGRW